MSIAPADPALAVALPAGARVTDYRIERVLGIGGFGITYLAHDVRLQLTVALKEFFPADLVVRASGGRVQPRADQAGVQERFRAGLARFQDEARALASFRHPHIVRVLRHFEAHGTACIVMEYESGEPLKHWLPRQGAFGQAQLMAVVTPLLDGLEAVHQCGFLHRDIKPDNIFIRSNGSPVLLDFGAAHRLCKTGEPSNIVSPGFAPFEQYHSQGHQGPWTDLYALGAVMYWMVTQRKPLDAAARVRSDPMPPASALADPRLFEPALLKAIEWAMEPDEKRRPQSVAALREALMASPSPAAGPARAPGRAPSGAPAASANASAALSVPSSRRNLLCTILFLDLIGYSNRPVDEQVSLKEALNALVTRSLRGVPEDTRMAIDTGDGAAVCFFGDPEEALHAALLLRRSLEEPHRPPLQARLGLHLGPVRVVRDINNRSNVVGDGINVAQRIMDFAQANQLLVSSTFQEVICRISEGSAALFRYLGPFQDKHGRVHEVYALEEPPRHAVHESLPPAYGRTVPLHGHPLDENQVQALEIELARHIGPLARVLVAKARLQVDSVEALRRALGPVIPDAAARDAFERPVGSPAPAPVAAPSVRSSPASQPSSGKRQVLRPLTPEEVVGLEGLLSQYIGPLARFLMRRELEQQQGTEALLATLAAEIERPGQREEFRRAALRLLSGEPVPPPR